MAAPRIHQDYPPSDLRQQAAREKDTRASLRLLAIANAIEGMTRAEAARLAGMGVRPCTMPSSASTLKALTVCTSGLALGDRSSSARASRRR